MNIKQIKRNVVLGILFFLPVTFLLFLYPAKHNYNTLDILKGPVSELHNFTSDSSDDIKLKEHLTVLGFFGNLPEDKLTTASNLNELIYSKFKGFKTFQVVIVVSENATQKAQQLKLELSQYDELKYWHFIFASDENIKQLFNNLRVNDELDANLSTDQVFIIDKELNLRGRADDRTDRQIEKNMQAYSLQSYNCIEIAELKNKMSEDVRILFTEYRQKRKGEFDSSSRRTNNIKERYEQD